ncbi:MAG: NifB/NifX family molybdenum-iron cluster-binding protein [Thermodesulfobacteriota bacterium]
MKVLISLSMVFVMFFSFTAFAAGPAKIAVAVDGSGPSAVVSGVAARSSYFLLFDEDGEFLEAVANPHKDVAGGAGRQAVELLTARGVAVVIAGTFGPKMVGAMEARGMRFLEFQGSAVEAVKQAVDR